MLLSEKPVLINDRTYLPVRAFAERLSISVAWDNDTQSVILNTKDYTFAYHGSSNNGENPLIANEASIAIIADGETLKIKEPIYLIEGRTYLPLRAVAEALELEVEWDNANEYIFLKSKQYANALYSFIKDDLYGFMNKDGKVIVEPKYIRVMDFSEGFAAVKDANEMWGYINMRGELVIHMNMTLNSERKCRHLKIIIISISMENALPHTNEPIGGENYLIVL